jgi:glucose/arabinose dehydrogenase
VKSLRGSSDWIDIDSPRMTKRFYHPDAAGLCRFHRTGAARFVPECSAAGYHPDMNQRSFVDGLEPRCLFATVPAGFTDASFAQVSDGTAMAFAPDGRLFVLSQDGKVNVVQPDGAVSTAVSIPVNNNGERGLLGIALSPSFETNHNVFLYYTERPAGQPSDFSGQTHNRISRFTMSGNTINPSTEQLILRLETVTATNHNGGGMAFGQDGKMYVGVGENAVSSNAQSLNNRLGKVLRLNEDGSIPSDNPTTIRGLGTTSGDNRAIYAAGLRNPFTLAFYPGSNELLINDVGASSFEEIDRITSAIPGQNFGWPSTEGYFNDSDSGNVNFENPTYAYSRGQGTTTGKTISGGAVYTSSAAGRFRNGYSGKYFFGDFGSGWINYIDPNSPPATLNAATSFAQGTTGIVDIDVGSDGALYYLQRDIGADGQYVGVRRIIADTRPSVSRTKTGTLFITGNATTHDEIGIQRKGVRLLVVTNGVPAGTFTTANVKRIRIAAGDGDDVVKISAGVRGISVDGGDGDDSLFGGDNADTLNGGDGHDSLIGYAGNDRLDGGPGRDTIQAGAGNDTLFGGSSVDSLNGGPGKDRSDKDDREHRVSIEILS